jgi:MoxR-like ATPase
VATTFRAPTPNDSVLRRGDFIAPVLHEIHRVIVGQDYLVNRLLMGMLCNGHLLVEGVPGLAKSLAVKTLADTVDADFKRIQFTPDLLPADLNGTMIYNPSDQTFRPRLGPIFTDLLLADEINRAPPKVQSALLEAMQERQVSIGGQTHPLSELFTVLATQNPIEHEGTYRLPEAQVDRFMMKVVVDYPTQAEERAIVDRALRPPEPPQAMVTAEDLIAMRARAQEVYVDPAIVDYAVRLVAVTRSPATAGLGELEPYVTYGGSPRASIALVTGARALAFLRGRDYVLPHDLSELALDVLRHRLVLSYEALADDVDADTIITRVLGAVRAPDVVLQNR